MELEDGYRRNNLQIDGIEEEDKKRPRTIVLRLSNFKEKSIILKNVNKLKGSGVYINEDFSRETNGRGKAVAFRG